MSEEFAGLDLIALTRRAYEAGSRGDIETVMSDYGPDSVWDMSPMGLVAYEGLAEIRRFIEEWLSSYEDFVFVIEEALDLGNGVTFVALRQEARPVGSSGVVQLLYGVVSEWRRDRLMRVTNYPDIAKARAIAERLAEERR
jgi:ketosteroid isomerase-like protein